MKRNFDKNMMKGLKNNIIPKVEIFCRHFHNLSNDFELGRSVLIVYLIEETNINHMYMYDAP